MKIFTLKLFGRRVSFGASNKVFPAMKKLSFILLALVTLGAGCLASNTPSTTTKTSALWIVSDASENKLTYKPIDWFSGDAAIEEAEKDGCKTACAPGGFYWRYQNDEDKRETWVLGNSSAITVKLICNADTCTPDDPAQSELKTVSFKEYLAAEAQCRALSDDCPYYSLGTGAGFFDITFSGGSIETITQHYVP